MRRPPQISLTFFIVSMLGCGDSGGSLALETSDAGAGADAASVADAGPTEADAGATARCGAPATEANAVLTDQGAARGALLDGGRTLVFRGLPYAAPPVGPRRWAAPEAPECFDGLFEATTFGPQCPQADGDGNPIGDEDCLQLNVWTPVDAIDGDPRPVLFFIHGGGNAQGSSTVGAGSQILYDGRFLSEAHDVVVVTINYRLGALGYLVHPDLDGETPSGNYGILDQIQALRWVQTNIRAMGGDPDRVMIFGESAGARNTCILVASPLAAGLFSAALMQSGGCSARTRDNVLSSSRTQVERSGCADAPQGEVACLRAKSAEALIRDNPPVVVVAGPNNNPGPHIDARVIPDQPYRQIEAGRHNQVPFVIGANADETSRSIVPPITTEQEYEARVRAQFGGLADGILQRYPAGDFDSPQAAFVAVTTDSRFVCTARADARSAARGQTAPVYRYFWAQGLTAAPRLRAFGAYHAVELFFVFDNLNLAGYRPTAGEQALARTVGGYWTRLARDANPNGPGAPSWPVYDPATDPVLVLDADRVVAASGIRANRCDYWDQVLGR